MPVLILALLGLAASSAPLAAQETRRVLLDLGTPVAERTVEPGTRLSFRLVSALPHGSYVVRMRRVVDTIPPLDLPSRAPGVDPPPDPCAATLTTAIDALEALEEERLVEPTLNDHLRGAGDCRDELLENLQPRTRRDVDGTVTTERGVTVVVEVDRLETGGLEAKEWEFRFTSGSRGEWQVTYGFTFVPSWWKESVFLDTSVDTTVGADSVAVVRQRFLVRQKERDGWQESAGLEFLPSILYQWVPGDSHRRSFTFSVTGGIGADLERVAMLVGGSVIYNRNLSLNAGLAVHRVTRRNRRYEVGDTLTEILEQDALHEESFRPNLFLGISLRLGENPFLGSSGDPEDEGGDGSDAEEDDPVEPPEDENGGEGGEGDDADGDGDGEGGEPGDDPTDDPSGDPGDAGAALSGGGAAFDPAVLRVDDVVGAWRAEIVDPGRGWVFLGGARDVEAHSLPASKAPAGAHCFTIRRDQGLPMPTSWGDAAVACVEEWPSGAVLPTPGNIYQLEIGQPLIIREGPRRITMVVEAVEPREP